MKYVLVIGAKSDIAAAVAREYAKQGYNLYLAARDEAALALLADDITTRYQKVVKTLALDILATSTHASIWQSLEDMPEGVICAVGYMGEQADNQNNFIEAEKVIDTNFTGVVSLLNLVANDFEKRKRGFIVAISSVAGDRGRKANYIYGAAKAGLSAYLSGLRNRLFESGVQVLTVKPGFVATKMTENMQLPEKLTAQPDEVAKDIFIAQQKGRNILYTKWIWQWIMLVIKHIPEFIFKRLSI